MGILTFEPWIFITYSYWQAIVRATCYIYIYEFTMNIGMKRDTIYKEICCTKETVSKVN